ncbi:MAG: 3-hydroxyacyl-ACP dehydratase FabZ [bacterium]
MYQLKAKEIAELLPHRHPFIFLDSVKELIPGKYALGIKNVTIDEPFFQGHFPDNPILPGVVIIEALAQLTAIIYASIGLENLNVLDEELKRVIKQKIGYLVKVNIKFMQPVYPGDQLCLISEIGKNFGNLKQVKVKVMVENQEIAIGELIVSEKGR